MSREDVTYLSVADVVAIHEVAMRESESLPTALVQEDALHSAVHHPRNMGWYAQAGLAEQAVEFMIHVAMAHAFVDGNKRTAVRSTEVFLALNGVSIPDGNAYFRFANMLIAWIAAEENEREGIRADLVALVEGWAG